MTPDGSGARGFVPEMSDLRHAAGRRRARCPDDAGRRPDDRHSGQLGLEIRRQRSRSRLGMEWLGYDDTGWPSGQGTLGYGDPFIVTTVPFGPDPHNKYPHDLLPPDLPGRDGAREHHQSPPAALPTTTGSSRTSTGRRWRVAPCRRGRSLRDVRRVARGGRVRDDRRPGVGIGPNGAGRTFSRSRSISPRASSTDLAMDLELGYFTTAQVVRGPYLQIGTPDGVDGALADRPGDRQPRSLRARPGRLSSSRRRRRARDGARGSAHRTPTRDTLLLLGGHHGGPARGRRRRVHLPDASRRPVAPHPTRIWVVGDGGTANADARAVRDAYAAYTADAARRSVADARRQRLRHGTDAEYQAAVFDIVSGAAAQARCCGRRAATTTCIHASPGTTTTTTSSRCRRAARPAGSPRGPRPTTRSTTATSTSSVSTPRAPTARPAARCSPGSRNDLAAHDAGVDRSRSGTTRLTRRARTTRTTRRQRRADADMRQNALPILEAGGVDLVLSRPQPLLRALVPARRPLRPRPTRSPDAMKIDARRRPRRTATDAYAKPTLGTGAARGRGLRGGGQLRAGQRRHARSPGDGRVAQRARLDGRSTSTAHGSTRGSSTAPARCATASRSSRGSSPARPNRARPVCRCTSRPGGHRRSRGRPRSHTHSRMRARFGWSCSM